LQIYSLVGGFSVVQPLIIVQFVGPFLLFSERIQLKG